MKVRPILLRRTLKFKLLKPVIHNSYFISRPISIGGHLTYGGEAE